MWLEAVHWGQERQRDMVEKAPNAIIMLVGGMHCCQVGYVFCNGLEILLLSCARGKAGGYSCLPELWAVSGCWCRAVARAFFSRAAATRCRVGVKVGMQRRHGKRQVRYMLWGECVVRSWARMEEEKDGGCGLWCYTILVLGLILFYPFSQKKLYRIWIL
jgi:hypothetical protein